MSTPTSTCMSPPPWMNVGGLLGVEAFPATAAGYRQLRPGCAASAPLSLVGVEGTGSYGAGLTRHLLDAGIEVVEVDRPNRQERRKGRQVRHPSTRLRRPGPLLSGTGPRARPRPGTETSKRYGFYGSPSSAPARTAPGRSTSSAAWCRTAPEELRAQLRGLSIFRARQPGHRLPAGRTQRRDQCHQDRHAASSARRVR